MSDRIARATALYQEGRYDEAEQELRPELEASPDDLTARALLSLCRSARTGTGEPAVEPAGGSADDAVTHADRGWARLRGGDARAALDSFREALRLDPGLEFARAGAAEAIEARSWVRRQARNALRGLESLGRFWWVLVPGYLVLMRVAEAVAERYPAFERAVVPLLVGYMAFVVATCTAGPLSDVVLRFSRFGRLALSRQRRVVANWIAACWAGVLVCAGFGLLGPSDYAYLWRWPATSWLILLLPVSGINACPPGWPRRLMTVYAGVLTAAVLTSIGLFVAAVSLVEQDRQTARTCLQIGRILFQVVLWASLAAAFGSPWLAGIRPRK